MFFQINNKVKFSHPKNNRKIYIGTIQCIDIKKGFAGQYEYEELTIKCENAEDGVFQIPYWYATIIKK